MDIAKMSMALNQMQLGQQVQLSLMSKVMDQAGTTQDGLEKMLAGADIQAIQQSVQPNLGANVDVKA